LQENKMALKKEFENLANDILENNFLEISLSENSLLEKMNKRLKSLTLPRYYPVEQNLNQINIKAK
ncbi:MAG: hypothetical protein V7782_10585, partial [Psychromonas sp.]